MASPTGVLGAVTERPRELIDDLDLRKRSKQAAKHTRRLTAEAMDLAEDVRERVGDPRERVVEVRDAATEASEAVRDRAEDLEPVLRKLVIDLLTAFRGLIGVLMAVPRLIVRGLGMAGDLLDRTEVAREKGHEYSERALDVAHNLPLSRRMRWRRRVGTTLLLGVAFAIGFAVGWVLAQRAMEEVIDEAPAPLQPVGEPLHDVTDGGETPESRAGA